METYCGSSSCKNELTLNGGARGVATERTSGGSEHGIIELSNGGEGHIRVVGID